MIGSSDPKKLADFYTKVLGEPDMAEDNWYGWSVGSSYFMVSEHSEVKGTSTDPSRIILNFETREVEKEFRRVKKEGAKVIKEPYEMDKMTVATLADPDGNYFQLMTPWK